MKRILTFICTLTLLLSFFGWNVSAETAEQPTVSSEAAIVMDAETGVTLYRKNEMQQLAPADSAQILTALLALESGKADQTVTVTKEIAATFDKNGTNIPLATGDEVKIKDLVYAMMLGSHSDAAKTIAAAVSGSEQAFTEAMTNRIRQITGTKSSTFANADGEPSDGNRTTAKDLAMLVREALKNQDFRSVFGATAYTMPAPNKNASDRPFSTICMLMRNNDMNVNYDATIGGKSGWNKDAKYTLVSAAERDGRTLICVVLGAAESKQRYQETISLFDYIFATFRNIEIPTSLLPPTEIDVVKDGAVVRKIEVSIPEGTKLSTNTEFQEGTMSLSALPQQVKEGETNITLTVSAKDQNGITVVLGSVILDVETRAPITEAPTVNDENLGGQTEKKKSFGAKIWDFFKTLLLIILYILLTVVVLAIVLFLLSYVQRKKRQARRKRRQEEQMEEETVGTRHASPYTGRRHKESAQQKNSEEEKTVEDPEENYENEF